MGEIGICEIDTRVSLSLLEKSDVNNFIFGLILFNNLTYNLCSFV